MLTFVAWIRSMKTTWIAFVLFKPFCVSINLSGKLISVESGAYSRKGYFCGGWIDRSERRKVQGKAYSYRCRRLSDYPQHARCWARNYQRWIFRTWNSPQVSPLQSWNPLYYTIVYNHPFNSLILHWMYTSYSCACTIFPLSLSIIAIQCNDKKIFTIDCLHWIGW